MPDKAEIVRQIFEDSISGLGSYTIAKRLNAKKVVPFGTSSKWDPSTVDNMLRSRAIIGEHQPKQYRNRKEFPVGDPVRNYYPAVIEESIFEAAQVARQKNLASGRGRKGRLITNLFAGLTTCAYCGSSVKFHSNGNAKSLICSKVLDQRGCFRMGWSYRDFENSFFNLLQKSKLSRALERADREALARLATLIGDAAGPEVYEARLAIATTLRTTLSELRIASAGSAPVAGKPNARIRRDGPGRYFEVRFRGGLVDTGFPLNSK